MSKLIPRYGSSPLLDTAPPQQDGLQSVQLANLAGGQVDEINLRELWRALNKSFSDSYANLIS